MKYRVGLSRELFDTQMRPTFGPEALALFDRARDLFAWEVIPEAMHTVTPDATSRYDGLYINSTKVTPGSFSADDPVRTAIIARHGVGFDSVHLPSLDDRGIILTNTPLAIRRPCATMALTFMLVLAQRLREKERLVREGRWQEREDYMGRGLTGRTLGLVGIGGISQELARLVRPFEMEIIATGRSLKAASANEATLGIRRVDLSTLMAKSDFVVVACPLNDETWHLINREMLQLMRPSAFLINVARGAIVDELALHEALSHGLIAGAGLDVFETEPVDSTNPLLGFDNVVATPHSLCWTDETFRGIAETAIQSFIDFFSRRPPIHIVNRSALAHPRVKAWFALDIRR
jgi:phosphoglycerate dehydrogenase-like enzyme